MKPCDDKRLGIFLYLDDELRDRDLAVFESHMNGCAACREAVADARRFLDNVRSARPLYTASAELRSRVQAIILDAPVYRTPHHLRARVQEIIERTMSTWPKPSWRILQAVPVFVLLVGIVGSVWMQRNTGRHQYGRSEFAAMAIDAHRRHVKGRLPLEVHSSSPEVVTAWFAGKVPFHLNLPAYRDMPAQGLSLSLEGARLAAFQNDYAAYIAYQVRTKPVSLIAVSSSVAQPSGGRKVEMKPLTFYYDSADGFNVVTWLSRTKDVTYALVSDLGEKPEQSCIVCHARPGVKEREDRDLMRSLINQ